MLPTVLLVPSLPCTHILQHLGPGSEAPHPARRCAAPGGALEQGADVARAQQRGQHRERQLREGLVRGRVAPGHVDAQRRRRRCAPRSARVSTVCAERAAECMPCHSLIMKRAHGKHAVGAHALWDRQRGCCAAQHIASTACDSPDIAVATSWPR